MTLTLETVIFKVVVNVVAKRNLVTVAAMSALNNEKQMPTKAVLFKSSRQINHILQHILIPGDAALDLHLQLFNLSQDGTKLGNKFDFKITSN